MAKFDFVLAGSSCVHRLEVAAHDLNEITSEVTSTRFVNGELDPDEWGQVRRVAIRSDRIQIIAEAE
jgi:hypothetical protein